MVQQIRHVEGPVTVAAAGTFDFWYSYPEKTPPSMIDLVAAQLVTGTGAWCTLYLVHGQQYMMIERSQLTADYPYLLYNHAFLMSVGDKLKCRFSGLAAADTVEWTVRGH
jgi:hypothetical protein